MAPKTRKQQQDETIPKWENTRLQTHEKKWIDEELIHCSEQSKPGGIDHKLLDKICSQICLALKFKSERWDMFLKEPKKK